MPTPSVSIKMQDRSTISAVPQPGGRSVLVVILSNKGKHNQVLNFTNTKDFIDEYGRPDLLKTGQGHYMATAALAHTSDLFIVRPVQFNSNNPANNQSIANIGVRFNDINGSVDNLGGRFVFTSKQDAINNFESDFISNYVFCNYVGYNNVEVGDEIFNHVDDTGSKVEVIEKGILQGIGSDETNFVYWLKLEREYSGSTTFDTEENIKLLVYLNEDGNSSELSSYTANPHSTLYFSTAVLFTSGIVNNDNAYLTFENGSNIVIADSEVSYNNIVRGQWIFPKNGSVDSIVQVSNKFYDDVDCQYKLVLNKPFIGTNSSSPELVSIYDRITTKSTKFVKNEIDISGANSIWEFYSLGAGSFYNSIYITGTRNPDFEKVYVDANGNPKYKNLFMDISIFGENPDGSSTLLEGPWTCSLINEIDGDVVRNIYNGTELYITKIINSRSNIINMKDGTMAHVLEGFGEEKDKLRLEVQSLFASNYVFNTETYGKNGFYLENGYDGNQYDKYGRLNINNFEITDLVRNVFKGQVESIDGSIEVLPNTKHSWFNFDYVVSGGYNLDIQQEAYTLVEKRQDCMLLADTGQYTKSASEDVQIKKSRMNWNTHNAMVYTQYREIIDPFNGKPVEVSPVYNYLQKHLINDRQESISTPVAGIPNGVIYNIRRLAYRPRDHELDLMIENNLNPTIFDNGRIYVLTQNTMLDRLSILKRAHAAKVLQVIRTNVPGLVKPLLQKMPTNYWIGYGSSLVNAYLASLNSGSNIALESHNVNLIYDAEEFKVIVSVTLKFPRVIEQIEIDIIVE